MDFEEAAILPYRLRKIENGTWVASCKFCDAKSASHLTPALASSEIVIHATGVESEGDHYDPVSGLYYSPERLAQVRQQNSDRRTILGSWEDTRNLNQAGL